MVRVPGIPPVQRHLRQRARGTGVQAVAKCCHAVRHLHGECRDDAESRPRRCPAADAESRPGRCPAAERTSNVQRAARGPAFVRQVASPLAGARTLLGDRGADFRHRPLAQGSIPPRAGQLPEPIITIRIGCNSLAAWLAGQNGERPRPNDQSMTKPETRTPTASGDVGHGSFGLHGSLRLVGRDGESGF